MSSFETPYSDEHNDTVFEQSLEAETGRQLYCALANTVRLGLELNDTRRYHARDVGISNSTYIKLSAIDPVSQSVEEIDIASDESSKVFYKMMLFPTPDEMGSKRESAHSRLFAIRVMVSVALGDVIENIEHTDSDDEFCEVLKSDFDFKSLPERDKSFYLGLLVSGFDSAQSVQVYPDGSIVPHNANQIGYDISAQTLFSDVSSFTLTPTRKVD